MQLLTIEHNDFTLSFECDKFDGVFQKAFRNIGPKSLKTSYTWTEGVKKTEVCGEVINVDDKEETPAFFFDNTNYAVWIDFANNKIPDKEPVIKTMRSDIQNNFSWHQKKGILSGFLNYSNDIGKSDFTFDYILGGERKRFYFRFTVLSSKLDYNSHWKKIIEDIETEYRMLSLDFLRRTYHTFAQDSSVKEDRDLIWWNLFKTWQDKFINSSRLILQRPRHRSRPEVQHVIVDRLKVMTPVLENEIAEHKHNPSWRYRSETYSLSNDTPENRFFKYALTFVVRRHERIVKQIGDLSNISPNEKEEMNEVSRELKTLCNHPFFRTVGNFKGLAQESLILQRADGYAALARIFAVLSASYTLKDGLNTLETKDIATLYEIWCFIAVKNIVKKIYGDKSFEIQNRGELSRRFVYDLTTGQRSRVLFKDAESKTELAELFYNAKTSSDDSNGIEGTTSLTVPQKPDIVLQLTKPVGDNEKFKLTYLFDAKYRIAERDNSSVDNPPDDAINQMHRYRDAIYYETEVTEKDRFRKEIIGGYILFPGNGEPLAVKESKFYKSIEKVNIGAFPLRPDDDNKELLEKFISELLNKTTIENALGKVIPHKGTVLHIDHPDAIASLTIFGRYHGQAQLDWILSKKHYNLPVAESGLNEEEAKNKRWIALPPESRTKDKEVKVFRITRFVGRVSKSDLEQNYDYYKSPSQPEYWLWEIK